MDVCTSVVGVCTVNIWGISTTLIRHTAPTSFTLFSTAGSLLVCAILPTAIATAVITVLAAIAPIAECPPTSSQRNGALTFAGGLLL